MKKIIILISAIISLLCVFQHSDAQTLSDSERYAAMDKNRVFLAETDPYSYYVSDVLDAEGVQTGYVEKVPVAIYKVVKENYNTYCYGILFGREVRLYKNSYLTFASDEDYDYLLMRGANGEAARKEAARQLDKVKSGEYKDRVAKEQELAKQKVELDKKKSFELLQYLRKNRAIIANHYVSEEYSDYSLKLEICNWFSKRIKYLDLTVMAVNNVGDPRWYSKSKSVKNIQCIGYIESLSNATYAFGDLFYDSSELINDIIVCDAVITFEDNSKITISPQAAAKMYVANHRVEFPDNFFQHIR